MLDNAIFKDEKLSTASHKSQFFINWPPTRSNAAKSLIISIDPDMIRDKVDFQVFKGEKV